MDQFSESGGYIAVKQGSVEDLRGSMVVVMENQRLIQEAIVRIEADMLKDRQDRRGAYTPMKVVVQYR